MDFALSFSFPFQDEEWPQKIIIAALISIIPILGQIAVLGWMIEITRRVIRDDPTPLPDWSDFGGLFTLGIKGLVVGIVVAIPLILLAIPFSAFIALLDPNEFEGLIALLTTCFSCFSVLYGIAMAVYLPASYGELAATDEIGPALNVGKVFGLIRAAPAAYIIVVVGMIVAGFLASLGVILCFIGVFLTTAYAYAIEGHLFGQAYKAGSAAEV